MKNTTRLLVAAVLIMAGTQAGAVIQLSPGDELDSGVIAGSPYDTNNNNLIKSYIEATYGVLLYKDNAGGNEEGSYAGSYETTYDDPADPEEATISYVSGPSISCPDCYLLVKDGNHTPWWYLFDINSWDGVMDIELTGFWPNGGAISHIGIYGTDVPEPGPLALLAIGLLGFGLRRLKKSS